jgi:hypothetical protein
MLRKLLILLRGLLCVSLLPIVFPAARARRSALLLLLPLLFSGVAVTAMISFA